MYPFTGFILYIISFHVTLDLQSYLAETRYSIQIQYLCMCKTAYLRLESSFSWILYMTGCSGYSISSSEATFYLKDIKDGTDDTWENILISRRLYDRINYLSFGLKSMILLFYLRLLRMFHLDIESYIYSPWSH